MIARRLGNTGIEVGEVGLGCGELKAGSPKNLERVVECAFELGVTLYDTADMYRRGQSEEILGRTFEKRRDKVVFATKFGTVIGRDGKACKDVSLKHMHEALEGSLRRLRTDHIDVYQFHNPPMAVLDDRPLLDALDKLVEQGKIRCYGMSIDNGSDALRFLDNTGGRVIQMIFSLFQQGARDPFLAEAKKRGAGVIVKVPLAGGTLTGAFSRDYPPKTDERRKRWGEEDFAKRLELVEKVRPILEKPGRTLAQGALAWLLTFDAVSAVIPGISSLEKMKKNTGAAGMRLAPDEMRALDELDCGEIRNLLLKW